jgi:hypothetical protein
MILGILGTVLCCVFAGVPAIILGSIARKEIGASSGLQEGRGMATAGIVLGTIGILFSVLAMIFFGFVVTSSEFQEGWREGYQEGTG